jgi:hypothetical protein
MADTGGGKKVSEAGVTTFLPHPGAQVIKEKISYPGFHTSVRIASNKSDTIRELASAFGVYTRSDGNSFGSKKYGIFSSSRGDLAALYTRHVTDSQVLNIQELATLWHLPNIKVKTSSIVWGTSVLSEPPDNLPTAYNATEEDKLKMNFFARTLYKNHDVIFGSKDLDRFRHMWILGKTGTGKSTLIANMAIDDFKKDRGVGIIDPHGDLCDTLLEYIPKHRINQTIYFNPADKEFPMVINPLEVTNREEAELVVSGIVSIFNKIFGFSWGPRLEYILRNTLLTLSTIPDTTLEDVLTVLTNAQYRKRIIDQTTDPVLRNFWINEFDRMPDKQREEAVSPILNKVGQFVTSPMIRRIIGQSKSSISIDQVMDEGKIFLANLSQGRLGEDNSALLGAMIITKFQLAAMRRVDKLEAERREFYLYVDEFQNFATPSFMKILSEARKYKLSLTLANQYMGQIPEEVQKSILGNAGTMIAFACGADDAGIIQKEFAETFSEGDLVNLANRQIAIKLLVDGHSTRPFIAHTLPLPVSKNQNRDKVIRTSRERWSAKPEPINKPRFGDIDREAPQKPQQQYGGGNRGGGHSPRPQQTQQRGDNRPQHTNSPRPQQHNPVNQNQPRPQGNTYRIPKPEEKKVDITIPETPVATSGQVFEAPKQDPTS